MSCYDRDDCPTPEWTHTGKELKDGELYLIWSIQHQAWWRPKEMGYTPSHDMAGRYSKEKAFLICARANTHSLDEIPVPAKYFNYQEEAHRALENVRP